MDCNSLQAQQAGRHTLITIRTFHFAVIARLGAVFAEMPHLLTVPTGDVRWIAGLVALLAHVTFLATVAAIVPPTGRAVLREVSHCKLLARK